MTQKPFYEISRRPITMTKSEELFLTWKNSVLCVRTDKSLYLLRLTYNLHCLDKKIDCFMTHIPCPKTSPATHLFPNKFLKTLSNFDYTQLIVNPSLWPHSSQIMEEMASIAAYEWSPSTLIHNESVIAVLNNVGNVELFEISSCGYKSVLNISSMIKENLKDVLATMSAKSVLEVKTIVDALETSAICWGPEHNGCVTFITAQKNGDIHFWQFWCDNNKLKTKHLTQQKSNCDEIVTIKVIPLTSDKFLLVVANVNGQLFVNKYVWNDNHVELVKSNCLWKHKDRMLVKHINHTMIDDKVIILCNKHRHLVALLFDDDCNRISEYVNNVNDYKITVISEINNEFYVGMINCNVYKINISVSGENLDVNLSPITIKENFSDKELFGVVFSKNSVICALAVVDRRIMSRKENISMDVIFLSEEASQDKEIKLLLNNPMKKLTEFWDCIEVIRYKTMKFKVLPLIDYNQLYANGSEDVYKLKLYYILLTLYHNLEKILKNNSKGWLPETSLNTVRDKILMLHSKSIVTNVYKQYQSNVDLIDLEKESFAGAKRFLDYYCQKYNVNRNELVPEDILDVIEVECEYTCQCCDEIIKGFTCTNGHINMFCALTLTPIEVNDYLVCKGCGVVARIELQPENPVCTFCDLHMNN